MSGKLPGPLSDDPLQDTRKFPLTRSAIKQEEVRLQEAMQRRAVSQSRTCRLEDAARDVIPDALRLSLGRRQGAARSYILLPLRLARTGLPQGASVWRIELHDLRTGSEPLGLDVAGDTIVGRGGDGSSRVDLDLDLYNAFEYGVSRRHAMLRPTRNRLFLIDLGSTNGTHVNALPLGPGVARALEHDDAISFGRLSCTIKIIDGPHLHSG